MSGSPCDAPCCQSGDVKTVKMELRVPSNGQDFKHPEPVMPLVNKDTSTSPSSVDPQESNGSQYALPLKTPDRRLLSSDNTPLEVRKRLLVSSYPDRRQPCDSADEKRRHVAKSLFGDSPPDEKKKKVGNAARSLFGTPTQEQNDTLIKAFDAKISQQYQQFMERYQIVEELDMVY